MPADTTPSPSCAGTAAPRLRLFDAYTVAGVSIKPPIAPALTPDDLLTEMDRCGVDEALVNSAATEISSPLATNADIARFCEESDRLHPVWNILPPQTGEMDAEDLFDRMSRHGVKALRAEPERNRFLLNAVTFGPLLERMIQRNIPLFLRANKDDWPQITAVLNEFPCLTVVATDVGSWGQDRYFRPLLERFENFYIETSSYELDGGIPACVEKYGPDRILFGSGYHTRPMGGASLLLRNLDIDADSKERIAHGNLERMLVEAAP